MPYAEIQLEPAQVPESIRCFVADRVEPYLRDVRFMLRAPIGHTGPQLNMSIAIVLCTAIGGLGRVFFNEEVRDDESFARAAERYPLADEPTNTITDPQKFASTLYDVYRCELVHCFGLRMRRANTRSRWSITGGPDRYVVARWPGLPRSETDLAALDALIGRAPGLPATLADTGSKIRLDVDAIYRGVRRLVHILATDASRQAIAVPVLRPWFEALRTPAGVGNQTMSSAQPYARAHALDATAGATSEIVPTWHEDE